MSGAHRATLLILACAIYAAGRAPFFGQWDSFDYLKQTVTHRLSDLGFGRPVFIGYNVALWEIFRRILGLSVLQVDAVVMTGAVIAGALGILVFSRLSEKVLPGRASRMATVALLLSPMYAVYSGFIMTEVPMLVALTAAASLAWGRLAGRRAAGAIAAGVLFGLAVGIREQAITLGAAYLWILWVRRSSWRARLEGWLLFSASAVTVIALPILMLYLRDPAWFFERTRIWLRAIPTGERYFGRNVEASLIYTLSVCPAAWLGLFGAGIHRFWNRTGIRENAGSSIGGERPAIPHPVWGVVCCILLPIAALWRDADVQIHPRYAMIALPGCIMLCASLFRRWLPGGRAAVAWTALHLAVFGIAQAGIYPFREIQRQKLEFSRQVMRVVPDSALIISGGYSPILDYYRGIGQKPSWYVLWSGWGWDRREVESTIRKSWARHQPVFWCDGPYGWLYFEDEWLDLYYIFKNCPSEKVSPGIVRVFPRY